MVHSQAATASAAEAATASAAEAVTACTAISPVMAAARAAAVTTALAVTQTQEAHEPEEQTVADETGSYEARRQAVQREHWHQHHH